MEVKLTHALDFHAKEPLTLQQLEDLVVMAQRKGFTPGAIVQIRAGVDDRDHDYYFYATITNGEAPDDRP